MFIWSNCVKVNYRCIWKYTWYARHAEFFEVCIKEEQFEAQKLEIMRDAVRAKTTYTTEAERMEEADDVPPSPTAKTNGNAAAISNGQ